MDTKSIVLDAALRLLRDEGAPALRVRRVATEAGCSTMGVYTHFGGKEGLVEALWLDGFRRFGQALDAVPAEGPPVARLRRLGHAYRAWALAHPTHYQLMFGRSVPELTPSEAAVVEARATFQTLVEAIAAAQGEGALRPGDPVQAALGVWGLVHGLVSIELADVAPEAMVGDREKAFSAAVETMIAGLATAS